MKHIITTSIDSNYVPRNSFFLAAVRSYLKSDKIAEFDSIDSKDGQIKYLLENKAHNALMQVRLVNFCLVSIHSIKNIYIRHIQRTYLNYRHFHRLKRSLLITVSGTQMSKIKCQQSTSEMLEIAPFGKLIIKFNDILHINCK